VAKKFYIKVYHLWSSGPDYQSDGPVDFLIIAFASLTQNKPVLNGVYRAVLKKL
jgi:hypothetical protein